MTTHLEIEYKTLLSLDEFDRLSLLFKHIEPLRQTNYYLDNNKHDLRNNRLSLRIRTFANSAEMTIKIPQKVGNMEYNIDLSCQEAEHMINSPQIDFTNPKLATIKDILQENKISLTGIHSLGSLTTIRREMQTSIGLMALDKNEYLDNSDYELELEVEDDIKGKQDFDDFLKKNKIEYRYAKSKVVRFLKALENTKK